MERYSMFLGQKNQYCEYNYTTKGNLQIQCDPYQITNGFFHRTGTTNLTIYIKTQKTLSSQSSLEKKEWSWRNQPSWLQTTLQSYTHQDSTVLTQKQKYRPIEQDREPRDKPTHLQLPYFWQRRQKYTKGQKQPLQKVVLGKLDSYVQKNEIRTLPNAIYKNKLKMD